MEFTVHGKRFKRTGSCNQCSGCYNACINKCPHGEPTGDGGARCTIYDRRGEVCEECDKYGFKVTHQVCIDFPNHPWLRVIEDGVCNYTFTKVE